MALGSCYIFFFQTHFRSVKRKGLSPRDDVSNSERTSYHDSRLCKKNTDIFRTFYQCKLRLSFLDWEPQCGDNIHHTVLSSATGLESPKSLASDRASFLDSFSSIGQVAFTSPSLCSSILVFVSIFKLIIFSMLDENFFVK